MRSRHDDDAVRITTAPVSPAAEIAVRQRRYLVSMGIRTACVILAVVFRESWTVWFFFAGAIFLPYVAVVLANVQVRRPDGQSLLAGAGRPELEGAHETVIPDSLGSGPGQ